MKKTISRKSQPGLVLRLALRLLNRMSDVLPKKLERRPVWIFLITWIACCFLWLFSTTDTYFLLWFTLFLGLPCLFVLAILFTALVHVLNDVVNDLVERKTSVKEMATTAGTLLIGLGVCAAVLCFFWLLVDEAGIVGLILVLLLLSRAGNR